MSSNSKKAVSFYIVLDSKPNKDGQFKVYIRFFLNGKKKDHFIGIRWDREKFDRINELLLPRYQDDPDVEKHNNLIKSIKSRVNKLAIDSYVKDRYYSIEDYIQAITHHASHADFTKFMKDHIRNEHLKGVIAFETYTKHNSILNRITEFYGKVIPMSSITADSIQSMEGYYRKLERKNNTITSYHKVFAKYIGIAVEKGHLEKNPYDKIKFRFVPGQRTALSQDEVKKLYTAFEQQLLPAVEHEVLRRFLFSCITGIRISDTHLLTDQHIQNDILVFTPHKTRKLNKVVKVPLPKAALKLIEDRKGRLFIPFADQSINRILKRIASTVGINEEISYHCARDTFGTIFIELGGDIKSLCDLMGHSSTKITEIYLKMADKRKQQLMNNFDSMF